LSNLPALVVSSKQSDFVGIPCLQKKKVSKSLQTVISSVDKVTHEDIICFGKLSTGSKEFEEVKELSMNISTDCYRTAHRLYVGLFQKIRLYQITEFLHVLFREIVAFLYMIEPLVEGVLR